MSKRSRRNAVSRLTKLLSREKEVGSDTIQKRLGALQNLQLETKVLVKLFSTMRNKIFFPLLFNLNSQNILTCFIIKCIMISGV